jgi:hypothetical protein
MYFLATIGIRKRDPDRWGNVLMDRLGASIPIVDRLIGIDIDLDDPLQSGTRNGMFWRAILAAAERKRENGEKGN